MKIQLTKLAHARSGDKGDTANVGVIALREDFYPVLVREVTSARVKEHFKGICKGEVERFELPTALRSADADESTRCIVIRGAGSDFCSGADLAALQRLSEASVAENLEDARSLMELFVLMREVRVPVIAAVHGRALAGGCGL